MIEIKNISKAFNGKVIIQTLFIRGEHKNERIDNTTEEVSESTVEETPQDTEPTP